MGPFAVEMAPTARVFAISMSGLWVLIGMSRPLTSSSIRSASFTLTGAGEPTITYHLNRAMDNGVTQKQAGEAMTQLAFYAGWPNVFSALSIVKEVIETRAD